MPSSLPASTGALLLQGHVDHPVDLYYRTRFRCPDPVVYLESGRYRGLVVSDLEYGRARCEASVEDVLTPAALGLTGKDARQPAHWALALVRRRGCNRVRVPGTFPLETARLLEAQGIQMTLAAGPLFPARQHKKPAELAAIAQAQSIAVRAMRAAVQAIRRASINTKGCLTDAKGPLTAERIRGLIQQTALDGGATADETIVACGRQAADPHARGRGVLRAGQWIVLDIFPRLQANLYWGDLTRSVIRGPADQQQKALYQAVRAAQRAALRHVRPGVCCETVHRAAADELLRQGFPTERRKGCLRGFIHATGHGLGLDIHEAPRIAPGNRARLRPGQVITIEPGWYDPDVGGVRIEDTVRVTDEGYAFLKRCPYWGEL